MKPAEYRIRHLGIHLELDPLLSPTSLDRLELPQDARNRVFHLELPKHASKADARAVVEGDILPRVRRPCFPALGLPFVGVGADYVVAAVEADRGVCWEMSDASC
jgi:hypothetical protein